jgi:hypothetical protein
MPNFGDINKELAKECKEETSSLKWNQNLIVSHHPVWTTCSLASSLSIHPDPLLWKVVID